jgi:TonB family protein
METVVQSPADAELHLLTDWGDADASARRKKAVVGTVLVHIVVIAGLISVPASLVEPEKPHEATHITILEPVTQLTQKAPNKGKVNKEFESRLETPRTAVQAPVAPLPTKPKPEAPRQAVIPSAPAPKPAAPQALPEPPKLDAGAKEPPRPDLPTIAQTAPAPPPQIQPVEKPKLALDNVPAPSATPPGQGRIAIPSTSVNDAVHDISRSQGGAMVIGDPGASGSGYGGITQTPTPGTPLSNVQLLSDPKGVDFRPYLIQLLATVKRNWMAVIPESVKLGRRGKVTIQFSIGNDGKVVKLVYAQNSGSDALDKAAVAGISASNPFPPLPREFKGDRIVLQLNFVYR